MSEHYEASSEEYIISTDPSLLHVDIIYNYLSKDSYRAQHIPGDVVERSISNSLCFGLYEKDKQTCLHRLR